MKYYLHPAEFVRAMGSVIVHALDDEDRPVHYLVRFEADAGTDHFRMVATDGSSLAIYEGFLACAVQDKICVCIELPAALLMLKAAKAMKKSKGFVTLVAPACPGASGHADFDSMSVLYPDLSTVPVQTYEQVIPAYDRADGRGGVPCLTISHARMHQVMESFEAAEYPSIQTTRSPSARRGEVGVRMRVGQGCLDPILFTKGYTDESCLPRLRVVLMPMRDPGTEEDCIAEQRRRMDHALSPPGRVPAAPRNLRLVTKV